MIHRDSPDQQRVSGLVAVLEKPDIPWDRRDLERLHSRLEDDYEPIERAGTLGRKLALVAASTLAPIELNLSLRLEVIIVLLILTELALALLQFIAYRC